MSPPRRRSTARWRRAIGHHRARRDRCLADRRGAARAAGGADRRGAARTRAVLVDCLTLWLTNLLLAGRDVAAAGRRSAGGTWPAAAGPVVLVSNEVGLGIVPLGELSRAFVDHAGRLAPAAGRRGGLGPSRRGRPAARPQAPPSGAAMHLLSTLAGRRQRRRAGGRSRPDAGRDRVPVGRRHRARLPRRGAGAAAGRLPRACAWPTCCSSAIRSRSTSMSSGWWRRPGWSCCACWAGAATGRYGVEQVAAACAASMASPSPACPATIAPTPSWRELSTLPAEADRPPVAAISRHGGVDNAEQALRYRRLLHRPRAVAGRSRVPLPRAGLYSAMTAAATSGRPAAAAGVLSRPACRAAIWRRSTRCSPSSADRGARRDGPVSSPASRTPAGATLVARDHRRRCGRRWCSMRPPSPSGARWRRRRGSVGRSPTRPCCRSILAGGSEASLARGTRGLGRAISRCTWRCPRSTAGSARARSRSRRERARRARPRPPWPGTGRCRTGCDIWPP